MKKKGEFTLDDVSELINMCKIYTSENANKHIIELGTRKKVLNQTCKSENDQLTLERIDRQYNSVRASYANADTHDTLEFNFEMMKKIGQLNEDMLKLEDTYKRSGDDDDSED